MIDRCVNLDEAQLTDSVTNSQSVCTCVIVVGLPFGKLWSVEELRSDCSVAALVLL